MTEPVKTDYMYLRFRRVEDRKWICVNKRDKSALGRIEWYRPWRQYCFTTHTNNECVFSDGCLKDICHFIDQLRKP